MVLSLGVRYIMYMTETIDELHDLDETEELRQHMRKALRKAFGKSPGIPDDWEANTDVAVQLMEIAAEITVRESLTWGTNDHQLFVEWAERAYKRAQGEPE